jgi:predicted anti-sigma-YlaC factor YlaD
MNHKLYEEWLFTNVEGLEGELTPDQATDLQEHLRECASCRELVEAWQEVEVQLQEAPLAAPQPGFANRWQARLEADLRRLHRRQTLAVLAFSVAGAALLLGSLALLALPWLQSPRVLLWSWIYRMFILLSFAETAGDSLGSLFESTINVVPVFWWVLFAGILSELGVLWIVSYRLLTNPRRITR